MRNSWALFVAGVSLACLCLVPIALAAAEGAAWVKVEPLAEGFIVQMPLLPERTVKETSTFAGTVEDVSYRAKRGGETFMATRVDLPGIAAFFMSDSSLLDSIRDSFLEKGNGTEKTYVDVKRDGYEGKKLDFTMHKDAAKEDARAEFFIVDGKMLSFTGIVPHGHSMADVDRFLASIDIED
ncbi:MAG: hypothetical protein P8R42_01145 [Candidatus Binatia bacterium]|nr:hypothetical protein [Candidatus Binatia bacterium]